MSEGGKVKVDDNARELLVLQALRALLGDKRSQTALVNLQNAAPAISKEIMAEAQARYDKFTLNNQEDINKVLIQINMASTKLRLKLIIKQGPKGILLLIPRMLKRLFFK